MSLSRLSKVSIAIAAAALIGGAALAHGPGHMRQGGWGMMDQDGGPGWGMMGWGRGHHMFGGDGSDWMLDRMDGRLAYIKAELKITEAQSGAWEDFASAVRTAAEHHNETMQSMMTEADDMALPERIDAMEQFIAAHLDEIRAIKASLDQLYSLLSSEQKPQADHIMLPMIGMGMHWGGRGRDRQAPRFKRSS